MFVTYDDKFFLCCLCLFDSFAAPSFTCFQMVVLFTSSVMLIGFDGMINDIFAFEISNSPGYGGGWSCDCCCTKRTQCRNFNVKESWSIYSKSCLRIYVFNVRLICRDIQMKLKAIEIYANYPPATKMDRNLLTSPSSKLCISSTAARFDISGIISSRIFNSRWVNIQSNDFRIPIITTNINGNKIDV